MTARNSLLIACLALTAATGAWAQPLSTPRPPAGEQATPMLLQALTNNDRKRMLDALDVMRTEAERVLSRTVEGDNDQALSDQLIGFYHLEIDMAQLVLAYATDPELRRLASSNIEVATARINSTRDWQVTRKILQQQITGPTEP